MGLSILSQAMFLKKIIYIYLLFISLYVGDG